MSARRAWLRPAIFFVATGLVCTQARAQEPEPVFKAEVKLVNLFATVRDKNGRFIRDLSKDDFTLTENDRPQTIRYFSRETDLPLVIGLMIDTSLSQGKVLDAERGASLRFFDQVLRETKDKVFVMQFDMGVYLRQELTSSRKSLDDTLPLVDTPSQRELMLQRGGGTLLYDAVAKASLDIMAHQSGRKALIILSDGVDTGSELNLAAAIEAAQRADAIVYSILFSDASYYGGAVFGASTGRAALRRMSQETGGAFFEVSKKHPVDEAFAQLEEELRSQYSVGYVSDAPVHYSEFRKVHLGVKLPGLVVETRERYWAKR